MKNYKVTNRSGSQVCYHIPEMNNLRREFAIGETKVVPYEELERLYYIPGGANLLTNYLLLEKEAVEELDMPTELEYNYGEKEIIELLTIKSQNAFLDALDFAPQGVIEIIKDLAVKLPLTDYNKIQALKDKTGFDCTKALTAMREEMSEASEKTRREAPVESAPTGRRESALPSYNVVSTKN